MLGAITDDVVTYAKTDIMLVKLVGDQPIKDILLPTAGGEHAQCAEQYAHSLAKANGGSLTVCQVVSDNSTSEQVTFSKDNLTKALDRLGAKNGIEIKQELINNNSVVNGIATEAKKHDAVMIGAAGKSIYPQILFGNIPEEIAKKTDKTVIVVKHFHPVKALIGKVIGE